MTKQYTELLIEGTTINLRLARESDFQSYHAFLLEPESNRLTGTQRDFSQDEISDWIKNISKIHEDRVDFMIISKDTDEFLGEVVLSEIDSINRNANIRIAIGMQQSGKGYGTEAMNLMLRYGFETLNLHRIGLEVYAFNPRAIHVYEKIGFQREGVQRDWLYSEGKFHDLIMMSILENEFQRICE
ncbi:GNAT family N-acetyltransferase [Paenibacillus macquariensis]|uniref:Protein N-acetyltransferase, RimJ/RimL family n=1 Tax=Paenibacillus macquariensis TaxID=948756 RepID=A0ABY1K7R1_9BACL|nr:GNAT family protein [Paenibacillus macquariensis]MEC0091119.1 GNAT family protein [Paenibacillus macquariensis]OAB33697.1 GCN5 family acetyltransferase [Paenibacillus macquariensis subsp. macquariensis]SIR37755.1 Protein N-acetyltransferase, RimJ/RimL family [Paenibacillus macquariensis]